jgi:hypothetical protein
MLKNDSNVVFAHEASPWRGLSDDEKEDEKMEQYVLSDYSDFSDSEEDAVSSVAESEGSETVSTE